MGAEDHAGALLRRPIPLLRCREQLRPVTLGLLLGVVGQVDMGQRVGGGGVGVLAASKVLAAALPRYLAPITTNGVQRLKAADDKQGSGGDKARRPPPTARARQPRQALQAGRAGCRWKSPHATPPASTVASTQAERAVVGGKSARPTRPPPRRLRAPLHPLRRPLESR